MEWLVGLVMAVALAALLCGLALIARRVRRRGGAGQAIAAAMAAYDQGFHPTAHEAFVELRAEDDRTQQAPSPSER